MALNLSEIFLLGVRTAFMVINDFTPKRTIDEFTRLIGDLRARTVDTPTTDTRTRLEARRTTVLQAQRVAVQAQASPDSVRLLQEEGALLELLSRPVKIERDVLAGSLDRTGMVNPVWQPVATHAGTTQFMLRNIGAAVAGAVEDRSTRDQDVEVRTRLQTRAEVLKELRAMVSPDARPAIDIKLAAVERVRAAIDPPVVDRSDPVRSRPPLA